ncbi:DUF4240 domain-containing protein [Kitasatospora sp. CB01950]|uniref:DUF4240 domain-containing protein n=1 Tax=Kitasatospora sp. CB01950 TaxID=1703930 RepID=UPI00093F22CB|nr:DUF4240 domain-containing protein [Kitasatospora sp. CB01950]OKJ13583.1 hypothetical protein AMK19_08975 [Kitasatospora sp. CB01950]
MDNDEFWQLIDSARAAATPEVPFEQALVDVLAALPESDILRYEVAFDRLHGTLYRWDIWAAAYLIGGGCSDDGFMDFRAGVISEGHAWYERVLAGPDVIAEHPAAVGENRFDAEEVFFNEAVNYAASQAFARRTGAWEEFHPAYERHRAERGLAPAPGAVEPCSGELFDFDDDAEMHRRLPRLAALYLVD